MCITLIRTTLLYGLLILSVRLMGKRQVAEMEPAEFVVTMLLANLASVPMQDNGLPLISGVVPIFTVLGLELMLAVLSMKFLFLRRMLCGVPSLLIRDGVIDQRALSVSRVSLDELEQKLREKDIFDYAQVAYAILETDGELTVLPRPQYQGASKGDLGVKLSPAGLYYNVVADGVVLRENLHLAGFDESWLQKELSRRGCRAKDVFLLAVNLQGKTRFVQKADRVGREQE
ncbi:MAG: DUF421 domain-containing protein [Oscillospiraceae bacterium]|nr:DUF421 domain-containing protein [Oscillospiraceae bacterium]